MQLCSNAPTVDKVCISSLLIDIGCWSPSQTVIVAVARGTGAPHHQVSICYVAILFI